jgi:serralysin
MTTGPSSSAAPYILAYEPNVRFTSIATVGDVIGTKPNESPYRMVGIPDGLGSWDNGDGTITVVMNHELQATAGIVRAHGATGAFVSQLVINKATLVVESAKDAITTVLLWDDLTSAFATPTVPYAIGRLCSADLAEQTAYQWTDTKGTETTEDDVVYGTDAKIFMTGEEIGPEGKEFGLVLSGEDAGKAYELAHTGLFSWENSASAPLAQRKTISVGTDDGLNGQVYVYIGEKRTEGTAIEKSGLVGGALYGIKVANLDNATALNNESTTGIPGGSFSLVKLGADTDLDGNPDGDVSAMTGLQLDAQSEALGVTSFLRPEDVSFDPTNPNVFYFATTNSFTGPSRLYKATFTDITNPESGGSIEAVLVGTEGQRMFDNITVNAQGKVILQEDVGNQAHIGKIWEYDPITDKLSQLANFDPALFTAGLPGFKTQDEESSGVIDVTNLLGDANTKAYLLDAQSHLNISATEPELVEDGQLLVMYVDTPELNGGAGNDNLFGSQANETFNGRGGNDSILAGSGNDTLNGGAGDDSLNGGDGNDKLLGGAGNDVLLGGAGADNLNGADGDDVLTGGAGIDQLFGGIGADRFVFTLVTDSNRAGGNDLIKDFRHSDGDIIDLSGIDANTVTADDQAFTFVNAFSNQAGQLVVSAAAGQSRYLYGDVNGDGNVDFILQVNSATNLLAGDFML